MDSLYIYRKTSNNVLAPIKSIIAFALVFGQITFVDIPIINNQAQAQAASSSEVALTDVCFLDSDCISRGPGFVCGEQNSCTYVPPVGIPAPSFGIEETYRMYDDVLKRNPALTYYQNSEGGFYTHYVDAGNCGGFTNEGAKVLCEVPLWEILPGTVIELHGDAPIMVNKENTFTRGTKDQPIFIRGGDIGKKAKMGRSFIAKGQYVIWENLLFDGVRLEARDQGGSHIEYLSVRNSEFTGLQAKGSSGTPVAISGGQNDIVVYNNSIHGIGTLDPKLADDVHGVKPEGGAHNIWILENHIYNMGGDSVQVGSASGNINDTTHIYIGRNLMHDNGENGIDVKASTDVIISENEMYGGDWALDSYSGSNIVTHDRAEDVWILNNIAHDAHDGIIVETGKTYVLGNLVYGLRSVDSFDELGNRVRDTRVANPYRSGACITSKSPNNVVANNTVQDCVVGIGVTVPKNSTVTVANNISADTYYGTYVYQEEKVEGVVVGVLTEPTGLSWALFNAGGTLIETNNLFDDIPNNISGSDLFVDVAAKDFRLKSTASSAIDKGIVVDAYQLFQNKYNGLDIRQDINGNIRPNNGAWDIGAFEVGSGTRTPIDGSCGSANWMTYTSTPTSGLCTTGRASAVSLSGLAYHWTCAPINGGTVTDSCEAVHQPSPPSIVTQPKSQSVNDGSTVTLSVVASGGTPLEYQWFKDTVLISGATQASYTTPVLTLADSNTDYSVVVTNNLGTIESDIVTVQVIESGIMKPLNNFLFPDTTQDVEIMWNAVPNATYKIRMIEYTDDTRTTKTSEKLTFPGRDCSNNYVCHNHSTTSITLPVNKGRSYLFWVHGVVLGTVLPAEKVAFDVSANSTSPICGDGWVNQVNEQCDDGNTSNGDGCDSSCQIEETPVPFCGDGIVNNSEACDGSAPENYTCTSTCELEYVPYCGDGIKNNGEQCDGTAGVGSNQECSSSCILIDLPFCGDGIVNNSEACDGSAPENYTCTSTCELEYVPYCGDGIKNNGEQCDGTAGIGSNQECSSSCILVDLPFCGDGIKNNSEACDGSAPENYTCTSTCELEYVPYCGDGIKNNGEQCDGTAGIGSNQECSSSCTLVDLPFCGDGIVNNSEACDGSAPDNYTCTDSCELSYVPYCGDGLVNQSSEACDGSAPENYTCTSTCELEYVPYCGDGIKNNGEQCDGTAGVGSNQECSSSCTLIDLPFCGDGIKNNSEACDGSAPENYTCTSTCELEYVSIVLPSVVSPINNHIFVKGTENVTISWDEGTVGGPYKIRAVEFTDSTRTTRTSTRLDSINDRANAKRFLFHNSYEETSVTIPVIPGGAYVFWVHGAGHDESSSAVKFDIGVDDPEPVAVCGDGEVNQVSEQCDDGNVSSGDGCTSSCQIEVPEIPDGNIITYPIGAANSSKDNPIVLEQNNGQLTIQWNSIPGASKYKLRMKDLTDRNSSVRHPDNTWKRAKYYLFHNEWTQTQIPVDLVEGHDYIFWMHPANDTSIVHKVFVRIEVPDKD